MRAISLSCRGLGNPETILELHYFVKKEAPQMVFLMETHLPIWKLEFIRVWFGMKGCFGVERDGYGVVWLFYGMTQLMFMFKVFRNIILIVGLILIMGKFGDLLDFMGILLLLVDVIYSWELLWRLKGMSDRPWLVMGDFNEIMSSAEKQGKLLRCPAQMAEFREALNDCLLLDLGYQGYEFTWTNNRDPPKCVDERLDRGVATSQWMDLFPQSRFSTCGFCIV